MLAVKGFFKKYFNIKNEEDYKTFTSSGGLGNADAYAKAHFSGDFETDVITINPYMGFDTLKPFRSFEFLQTFSNI